MNTLGFVARQIESIAVPAPRAPPSTPTSEGHEPANIRRVSTWSTSLLFPPRPQRTQSSPSFVLQRPPSGSISSTSTHLPTLDVPKQDPPQSRSKHDLESVINQIFFLRVFLVVWSKLKVAWTSLVGQMDGMYAFNWRRAFVTIEINTSSRSPSTTTLSPSLHLSSVQPQADSESLPASEPSTEPPAPARRSAAALSTKKSPFHLQKTLVLDLDETLIHSTSRPLSAQGGWGFGSLGRRKMPAGRMVEVVLNGKSTLYHVYKRPFVDFFLRTVSGWYTLVIYTASMQEYADPVIDWLDAGTGILTHRLFRDSCTQLPNGTYTKDLSIVDTDLSQICLVDNSPISYSVNEANGIPIEGWTNDPSDEALLDLLPVLDSLRFTSDVRRVLGLRCVGSHKPAKS
ncbi:NLI interacting factor-like phosphatase [Coprinopsis sp. MPI-PUGE-AT-0042]|nr:NLI interacting factor-like phosphatase [Coprinopsis sp. MPI-PUGE-AT-0042]